ncbi:DUF2637 domain-containing protein [Kitasatospora sp. NPDC050543]|uniref:DUF2637 domain-containing protein n=1 Tax=Kitasatospora sp. NPDC050543 TaxID=3364054 RepID=UPI003797C523
MMYEAPPFFGLGTYQEFDDTAGGISIPREADWFYGTSARQSPIHSDSVDAGEIGGDPRADFTQLSHSAEEVAGISGLRQPALHPPIRRRRRRVRGSRAKLWPQVLSTLFGALAALIVATVSVLGWMLSYNPLQDLASTRVSQDLAQLWPLVVYGPWLVASLSILRATLARHRATQSWVVVVLFSSVATALCVIHASRTLPGVVVAALPPLTAVISFHQLVRQVVAPSQARPAASGRRPVRRTHR